MLFHPIVEIFLDQSGAQTNHTLPSLYPHTVATVHVPWLTMFVLVYMVWHFFPDHSECQTSHNAQQQCAADHITVSIPPV